MAAWLWTLPAEHYPVFLRTGTFAVRRAGRAAAAGVRAGDRIVAYLSGRRAVAGLFEATGGLFEDAVPLVPGGTYRHRVRVRPLVALPEEAYLEAAAFADRLTVLEELPGTGPPEHRLRALALRGVHPLPELDARVLEFLVRARAGNDLPALEAALDAVRAARDGAGGVAEPPAPYVATPTAPWDRAEALEALLEAIAARGFAFAPWRVAAFVTALRTKPFALLAGITGVGKSRLPALVAEATGGVAHLVPVRPDWTDPAEVLGYTDLQGRFRPGALLRAAQTAETDPARFHVAVLDEMNLARPEHYLAEVLSRLEARRPAAGGGLASDPLLDDPAAPRTPLPPNLALVGTVNVDEAGHAFSRKVLDRAFTLELDAANLRRWGRPGAEPPAPRPWPAAAWRPRAASLADLADLDATERRRVEEAVDALAEADARLAPAGLGVGYRARDEAALFVLHAAETPGAFRTEDGEAVDPLDLALLTKVLPRVAGGRRAVRRALAALLAWAAAGAPLAAEEDLERALDDYEAQGAPEALEGARFPRTAARAARMLGRLREEGFASFWEG